MSRADTALVRIRLADVFARDRVLIGLATRTTPGVVAEMMHRLVETGHIGADSESSLVKNILARETMGSTAIGNGIAFPHCRTSLTDRFIGVIAVDREGIDFGALDRQPVHVLFLLLGPLDQREQHFDILGRISSLGRDKTMRMQLRGSCSPSDVLEILEELDGTYA